MDTNLHCELNIRSLTSVFTQGLCTGEVKKELGPHRGGD